MRFNVSDKSKVVLLAAAFMALAYEACGTTLGLGALQEADGVNRDNILELVPPQPDSKPNVMEVYGDYVAGRMVKTGILFNEVDGWVEVSDNAPRPDYQGWSSGEPSDPGVRIAWRVSQSKNIKKYASYRELLEEAARTIGMAMTPEGDRIVPLPTHKPLPPEEVQALLKENPLTIVTGG